MKQVSRSDRKYGFRIHAFIFVLTMVLLAVINLTKGPPYWVLWALLGWGMALLAHWWFTLGPGASTAGSD